MSKTTCRSDISRCEYTNETEWEHVWEWIATRHHFHGSVRYYWCSKCGALRWRTEGKYYYKYRSES